MNRLGIFCFFDKTDYVDEYKLYFLRTIRCYLTRLIVVCNSTPNAEGLGNLERLSDKVIIRDNLGLDAGAYKDVLLELQESNEYWDYDEIILFNDTVYGPFDSWKSIFEKMDKLPCDFWGLMTSQDEPGLPTFVHSFFIAFRKNVLLSKSFLTFWKDLDYPKTYNEDCEKFELTLTELLEQNGFTHRSYIEGVADNNYLFVDKPIELLKAGMPFLKYKSLHLYNYIEAKKAYDYVEQNYDYDLGLIVRHQKRKHETGTSVIINYYDLEYFVKNHERIYVYGYGEYGKSIEAFFEYMGWNISGFVETNPVSDSIIKAENLCLNDSDGIVVALGIKGKIEVLPTLKMHYSDKQLFV